MIKNRKLNEIHDMNDKKKGLQKYPLSEKEYKY
jgi:hypothetical protein